MHLQNLFFRLILRKQLRALPSSQSTQSKVEILLSVLWVLESALQPVPLLWRTYRFCRCAYPRRAQKPCVGYLILYWLRSQQTAQMSRLLDPQLDNGVNCHIRNGGRSWCRLFVDILSRPATLAVPLWKTVYSLRNRKVVVRFGSSSIQVKFR
ncbi:hypothetical protein F5879DRAFT_336741 [Lentinula edodes]|nr:hypothetical protein F5879DRAFT_336741 [Lentinula edodes]